MVNSESISCSHDAAFVSGEADASRTCKDDDLPFCAFRVHEQFIVGDDGGHGGNPKPGSRTEEQILGLGNRLQCTYVIYMRELARQARATFTFLPLPCLPRGP